MFSQVSVEVYRDRRLKEVHTTKFSSHFTKPSLFVNQDCYLSLKSYNSLKMSTWQIIWVIWILFMQFCMQIVIVMYNFIYFGQFFLKFSLSEKSTPLLIGPLLFIIAAYGHINCFLKEKKALSGLKILCQKR